MAQKLALLIGNSEYQDEKLGRLKTPDVDVDALARVLRDPAIGGFDDVTPLINQSADTIRRAIARFLARKKPDDLLLLYFSGHGVLDNRGHLYLATKKTEHNFPSSTAIRAAFITDEMDNSRSKRQVLVLDCCHSGAFARGTKGGGLGRKVVTEATFEGEGFGRVVLTASDEIQQAWEGGQIIGEMENSLFTHYLIQGLETGEADADIDGRITLDEWYDYAYAQVVQTAKQTPGKWSYKQQGEIIIARNPNPVVKSAELPAELQQAIESRLAGIRLGAVQELNELLQGSNKGLALAAQEALKGLTDDDSRSVSAAAAEALAGVTAPAPPPVTPVEVSKPTPKTKPAPSISDVLTISEPIQLELVRVPAGEFLMGSDPKKDKDAQNDEQPQHTVSLPDYYVAKTPVTNAQYAAFVQATGHQTRAEKEGYGWGWTGEKWDKISGADWRHPRGPDSDISNKTDHPVVQIAWADAVAFCQWLSQETDHTVRLPTEAEWEKAARGADGRIYPWGNEWDRTRLNSEEGGVVDTTPVGRYSPQGDSPYGAADMAGNVWEWCATKEGKSYPYDTAEDEWSSDYLTEPGLWVVRGGSWNRPQYNARCAHRDGDDRGIDFVGCRVVVSPSR